MFSIWRGLISWRCRGRGGSLLRSNCLVKGGLRCGIDFDTSPHETLLTFVSLDDEGGLATVCRGELQYFASGLGMVLSAATSHAGQSLLLISYRELLEGGLGSSSIKARLTHLGLNLNYLILSCIKPWFVMVIRTPYYTKICCRILYGLIFVVQVLPSYFVRDILLNWSLIIIRGLHRYVHLYWMWYVL